MLGADEGEDAAQGGDAEGGSKLALDAGEHRRPPGVLPGDGGEAGRLVGEEDVGHADAEQEHQEPDEPRVGGQADQAEEEHDGPDDGHAGHHQAAGADPRVEPGHHLGRGDDAEGFGKGGQAGGEGRGAARLLEEERDEEEDADEAGGGEERHQEGRAKELVPEQPELDHGRGDAQLDRHEGGEEKDAREGTEEDDGRVPAAGRSLAQRVHQEAEATSGEQEAG